MSNPYAFSCSSPVSPDNLPDIPHLLLSARALLSSTNSWSPRKRFHRGLVQTYEHKSSQKGEGAWFMRVSELGGAGEKPKARKGRLWEGGVGFDDLWWALGVEHSLHEQQYVPDLKQAILLRRFSPTVEAWCLYYTFPPPIAPRSFTILLVVDPPTTAPEVQGQEEALLISLPYTPSAEEEQKIPKSVRGKYCSIERIRALAGEDKGKGKVEWRMAVQSDARGGLPMWLQEMSVPGKIAADVPYVLKWLKTHPRPPPPAASASGEAGPSTTANATNGTNGSPASAALPPGEAPNVPEKDVAPEVPVKEAGEVGA